MTLEKAATRRRVALFLTAAVVVLVVAGGLIAFFSGGDDDGDTGGNSRTGDGTGAEEDSRRGGVLRVAAVDLRSLDPAEAREPVEMMVADHLFDTLTRPDGSPGLAAKWEAGDDLRQFTFHLRKGARFHNGNPVTAQDVKVTLERIAAPGSKSDFRFLLETVTGYAAYHVAETAEDLAGVTVVDPRTVRVALESPFAEFPGVLSNPGFGIVPAGPSARDDFASSPVGSGPLKMAKEQGEGVVSLERFDRHKPGVTLLDGIDLQIFGSATDAFGALGDGAVDMAPVPADSVEDAADEYGEAGLGPFTGVLFYGMNVASEQFSNPKMREAVLAAVDRERIVSVAYSDTVLLAEGFVPAGIPGGVDDACGERCEHNPGKAERLLGEAFPDGKVPTVHVDYDVDPVQEAVAKSIRRDLRRVGIPAELRPHEFAQYGPFLVSGAPELFRLGWTADYPSADAFLYPLFRSGQNDNLTRLNVPEVDQLLERARAEPDEGKRAQLHRQAEELILDRFPVIPIAQFTNRWAAGDHVQGFTMSELGTFDVTRVFLDD